MISWSASTPPSLSVSPFSRSVAEAIIIPPSFDPGFRFPFRGLSVSDHESRDFPHFVSAARLKDRRIQAGFNGQSIVVRASHSAFYTVVVLDALLRKSDPPASFDCTFESLDTRIDVAESRKLGAFVLLLLFL